MGDNYSNSTDTIVAAFRMHAQLPPGGEGCNLPGCTLPELWRDPSKEIHFRGTSFTPHYFQCLLLMSILG